MTGRRPGTLSAAEWVEQFHRLMTRAGGLCEARTPDCLAPGGRLETIPRELVSVQHRRARGAGGTVLEETNSLANLLLLCGTGVTGCHGWIETKQRAAARAAGWMVDHTSDGGVPVPVECYPVRVGGGRWRALHPTDPVYVDLPLAVQWSPTMPTIASISRIGIT